MISTYVRESGLARAEADERAHEAVPFLASCPKCKHQRVQHGYDRGALVRLFHRGYPVRAYCQECEESWAINAHEGARLASWLFL
jgi:hypothetical protein